MPQTLSSIAQPASSVALSRLVTTGTPDSSTYLRGDGTWSAPAGGSGITNPPEFVGFNNVQFTKIFVSTAGEIFGISSSNIVKLVSGIGVTLVSGVTDAEIDRDSGDIYYIVGASVYKLPYNAANGTLVVTTPDTLSGITVFDSTKVVVYSTYTIVTVNVTNSTFTRSVVGANTFSDLTVDETGAPYIRTTTGGIFYNTTSDLSANFLKYKDVNPGVGLVHISGKLYYHDSVDSAIYSMTVPSTTTQLVASNVISPKCLFADGLNLGYLSSTGSVRSIDTTTLVDSSIFNSTDATIHKGSNYYFGLPVSAGHQYKIYNNAGSTQFTYNFGTPSNQNSSGMKLLDNGTNFYYISGSNVMTSDTSGVTQVKYNTGTAIGNYNDVSIDAAGNTWVTRGTTSVLKYSSTGVQSTISAPVPVYTSVYDSSSGKLILGTSLSAGTSMGLMSANTSTNVFTAVPTFPYVNDPNWNWMEWSGTTLNVDDALVVSNCITSYSSVSKSWSYTPRYTSVTGTTPTYIAGRLSPTKLSIYANGVLNTLDTSSNTLTSHQNWSFQKTDIVNGIPRPIQSGGYIDTTNNRLFLGHANGAYYGKLVTDPTSGSVYSVDMRYFPTTSDGVQYAYDVTNNTSYFDRFGANATSSSMALLAASGGSLGGYSACIDSSGNYWQSSNLSSTTAYTFFRVSPSGTITNYTNTSTGIGAICFESSTGFVYYAMWASGDLYKIDTSTGISTLVSSAVCANCRSMTSDSAGTLYFLGDNGLLKKFVISTLTTTTLRAAGTYSATYFITYNPSNATLYATRSSNTIWTFNPNTLAETASFYTNTSNISGLAYCANDNSLYFSDITSHKKYNFSTSSVVTISSTTDTTAQALITPTSRAVYAVDSTNNAVYIGSPNGTFFLTKVQYYSNRAVYTTINGGITVNALEVDPTNNLLFAANGASIVVYNATTFTALYTLTNTLTGTTTGTVYNLRMNPNNGRLTVRDQFRISEIDLAAKTWYNLGAVTGVIANGGPVKMVSGDNGNVAMTTSTGNIGYGIFVYNLTTNTTKIIVPIDPTTGGAIATGHAIVWNPNTLKFEQLRSYSSTQIEKISYDLSNASYAVSYISMADGVIYDSKVLSSATNGAVGAAAYTSAGDLYLYCTNTLFPTNAIFKLVDGTLVPFSAPVATIGSLTNNAASPSGISAVYGSSPVVWNLTNNGSYSLAYYRAGTAASLGSNKTSILNGKLYSYTTTVSRFDMSSTSTAYIAKSVGASINRASFCETTGNDLLVYSSPQYLKYNLSDYTYTVFLNGAPGPTAAIGSMMSYANGYNNDHSVYVSNSSAVSTPLKINTTLSTYSNLIRTDGTSIFQGVSASVQSTYAAGKLYYQPSGYSIYKVTP